MEKTKDSFIHKTVTLFYEFLRQLTDQIQQTLFIPDKETNAMKIFRGPSHIVSTALS